MNCKPEEEKRTGIFPEKWADWESGGMIGKGSFGRVYLAERGQEQCAIKVISLPGEETDAAAFLLGIADKEAERAYLQSLTDRYEQEIALMYSLRDHPCIVRIEEHLVEWETDADKLGIYIRMELLQNLTDFFTDHVVTEEAVIRLGMDICCALSACEEKRIIHRDIKPGNIFSDGRGHFKLGDFGTARLIDETGNERSTRGTYSFMAPEVYLKQEYDERIDQYSLGIMLYRLMNNGRDPFVDPGKKLVNYGEREEALKRRMAGEELPPPSQASDKLSAVIQKACSFDPDRRYRNADDMKADLALAGDPDVSIRRLEAYKTAGRKHRRPNSGRPFRRWLLPGILLMAAGLTAGGAWWCVRSGKPGQDEKERTQAMATAAEPAGEMILSDRGKVPLREQPPSFSAEMEEALETADPLVMQLASLSMKDPETFASLFEDTDTELIDDYYTDFRKFRNYDRRICLPVCVMDGTYVINVIGYLDSDVTWGEGVEWSAGWLLFLKKTEEGWKVSPNTKVREACTAFLEENAFPAGFSENIAAGRRNSVMIDMNNYMYLDEQAVYEGMCTMQVRFLWQDQDGNLYVSVLFVNGQEMPYVFEDVRLQLNDRRLGTILNGALPGDITVPPGTNVLRTWRFEKEAVLTGPADWMDVTPVLSLGEGEG